MTGFIPILGTDWREDIAIIVTVAALFTLFTGLSGEVRFAVTAPADFLIDKKSDLVFDQDDIELMNDVSSNSIGLNPQSDERLYCFSVRNDRVRDFRFADTIQEGSITSVSGGCRDTGDTIGFVHSQPFFESRQSVEDRTVSSRSIQYSCIQYDRVTVSPVSGELGGLKCWELDTFNGADEPSSWSEISVGVAQ